LGIIQIWTASALNNVVDIHVIESNLRHCWRIQRKIWTSCSRNITTNVWLDKFYKKQMKSENHEICHDIVLSYVKTVVKNWEDFSKVDTYVAYKSKNLQRRSTELRSSSPEFESKVRSEFGFDFKTFCICNNQLKLFHAKFW